jgi:hypothetical protein
MVMSVLYFSQMYGNIPSESLEEILKKEGYQNLIKYGQIYETALKYKAINFLLVALEMIPIFSLNSKIQFILVVAQKCLKPVVMLLIFLFSIVAGFAAIY